MRSELMERGAVKVENLNENRETSVQHTDIIGLVERLEYIEQEQRMRYIRSELGLVRFADILEQEQQMGNIRRELRKFSTRLML